MEGGRRIHSGTGRVAPDILAVVGVQRIDGVSVRTGDEYFATRDDETAGFGSDVGPPGNLQIRTDRRLRGATTLGIVPIRGPFMWIPDCCLVMANLSEGRTFLKPRLNIIFRRFNFSNS